MTHGDALIAGRTWREWALGALWPACLMLIGMAAESFAAAAPDAAAKRFKQVKWPEKHKPERFVAASSLARLDPASAEIILLMTPPRERPGKDVQLESPADACRYLTRNLHMAAAPTHVAAYRARPKTHYVFSGGTSARPVDDFSSGVVLAEDGRIAVYKLDWTFFDKLGDALRPGKPDRQSGFWGPAAGLGEVPDKLDKLLAAAVLVGDGDSAAMPALLEGARLAFGTADSKTVSRWALNEAARSTHTEKALPLWRAVVNDKDEDKKVRDWAAAQVRRIKANDD